MAQYRLTGIYDQPLVDPFEWIAQGRPVGAYPTRTYRPGDTIKFRDNEERDRLLSLGVVEEAPEGTSSEDQQREIEERRKAAEEEQRDASKGSSAAADPPASPEVAALVDGNDADSLREMAAERDLPQSGSKRDLAERIVAHDASRG